MSTSNTASKPAMTGSCRCGAARFECSSLPEACSNCYCQICVKLHGAAFATFATVPTADLTWHGDRAELRVTSKSVRTFCPKCFAPLSMQYASDPDETDLVMAAIEEDSAQGSLPKPSAHIFVGQKVNWYTIPDDGCPQYKTFSKQWLETHPDA